MSSCVAVQEMTANKDFWFKVKVPEMLTDLLGDPIIL